MYAKIGIAVIVLVSLLQIGASSPKLQVPNEFEIPGGDAEALVVVGENIDATKPIGLPRLAACDVTISEDSSSYVVTVISLSDTYTITDVKTGTVTPNIQKIVYRVEKSSFRIKERTIFR